MSGGGVGVGFDEGVGVVLGEGVGVVFDGAGVGIIGSEVIIVVTGAIVNTQLV